MLKKLTGTEKLENNEMELIVGGLRAIECYGIWLNDTIYECAQYGNDMGYTLYKQDMAGLD